MFRKYLLINLFLLVGCVASAQDGANPAPGIVIINPSSSGGGGGGTPSGAVTVSGIVCTITAITNGIITAASCTP